MATPRSPSAGRPGRKFNTSADELKAYDPIPRELVGALRTMISKKYGSLKDFHQAFTEAGNRLSYKELSRQLSPSRFPYGPDQHWALKIVELCAPTERERITALCKAARNGRGGCQETAAPSAQRDGEQQPMQGAQAVEVGSTVTTPAPSAVLAKKTRRWRSWISLVTTVLVLAAGIGWTADKVFFNCGWLGSGMDRVDGECVGVTDGSYLFDPAFKWVQNKIAAENEWVRKQSSYVTVALLNPLTATPTSALSAEEILEQLEGAYTAQYRVNRTFAVDHSGPPIQLVLANEGSTEDQWHPVVSQLVEMASQDNPLVAVIGLGLSIVQTKQGAEMLSRHGIPMVGALIAADGFDYNYIPGLIRVSPTSRDYAKSLRGYLDTRQDFTSAVLVSDSNSDFNPHSDIFTRTLRDAFRDNMGGLIEFPTQTFPGGGFRTNASPGVFATITPNICAAATQGSTVVLYAGARDDLDGFLTALENRVCQDTPLTVMAAGIKYDLLSKREQQLRAKNLTVVFSAWTNARGWGENPPGTLEGYPAFLRAFTEAGFNPRHLEDDRAILTHDALLTAAQAVRLAAEASHPGAPTASDVRGQLLNLNGLNNVPGASGTLSFSFREQDAGNPQGKPVPVFQFPSSTRGHPQQMQPAYITP